MKRRLVAVLVSACLLGAIPGISSGGTPSDLDRRALLTITGHEGDQGLGSALATAGDVNGDLVADLLIRPDLRFWDGHALAYVVFGGGEEGSLDTSDLGDRGFAITTSESTEIGDLRSYLFTGLGAAGDVNGDGLDDVLVGMPWADSNGRTNSGSVFVVFGKADSSSLDVSNLSTDGLRIDGASEGDELGVSVASADADGDDQPDIVMGAPFAGTQQPAPGAVYVLYGSGLQNEVDLAQGIEGYSIEGAVPRQAFGAAVAGAGDMNGDGRDEIVIGAPSNSYNVRSSAYVAVAEDETDPSDEPGRRIWEITSRKDRRRDVGDIGHSVAGGADFNGDGVPDVIIGAPRAPGNRPESGAAYVVFGDPDPADVQIGTLGSAGVKISGAAYPGETGASVVFLADHTGDGRAEAAIGSPAAHDFGAYDAGRVDIVPGTVATTEIDLASEGTVVTYLGDEFSRAGASLAEVPGFAGGEMQLLAVGAPHAVVGEEYRRGRVYVVPSTEPANDLPPRATLYSYRARQRGLQGSFCWDGTCVDYIPSAPPAETAAIKDKAIIRLGLVVRPTGTALTYFRGLDEFGRPAGPGKAIPHRVRKTGARGSGYEVRFRLPRRLGDAYFALQAAWSGEERGDSSWFFHLDLDDKTYTDIASLPDARLLTGNTEQNGLTFTYSWSQRYVDGSGSTLIADAFSYGFPKAVPAVHGARALIRVDNKHRPDRLFIWSYPGVEREDPDNPLASEYPRGPKKRHPFRWRAVEQNGRVIAHEAVFRLPRRGNHAYIEVRGRWRWHGTAPWQFHVRFTD